jgi:penicillin amidase
MMAAHLPRRPAAAADDDIAAGPSPGWETPLTGADLPHEFDPAEGFLASANERPAKDAGLVGRHFSAPYRKARLDQLLRDQPVSVAALMRLQRDVHSAAAKAQLAEILAWAGTRRSRRERELVAALAAWDGGYTAGSRAAAAFELLLYHLVRLLVPRRRRAAWHAAWGSRRVLWDAVVAADPARRERCLARALRLTARRGLRVGWGQRHRLRLAHPLARVPVLGRSWVYADRPAPGAWDTLMKAGAGLAPGRHDVEIGSVARHVSDLGDPDRNHFVLLGGQDGWPGSTTALDQVALWESGAYLLLPMSPAAVAASFPLTTEPRP